MTPLNPIGIGFVVFAAGMGTGALISNVVEGNTVDWVSFAGAVIGAAVTVLGALLLTSMQASNSARERRRLLTDQFGRMRRFINSIEFLDDHETEHHIAQNTLAEHLAASISLLKRSCEWVTPDNAAMVKALAVIQQLPDQIRTWKGDPANPTYFNRGDLELEGQLRELDGALSEAERLLQKGASVVEIPPQGDQGH